METSTQGPQIHNETIYTNQNEAVEPNKYWWSGRTFPVGTSFPDILPGLNKMVMVGEADVSTNRANIAFEAAINAIETLIDCGGVTNYQDCPQEDGSMPLDVPIGVSISANQLPNGRMKSITVQLYVRVADGT